MKLLIYNQELSALTQIATFLLDRLPDALAHICEPVGHLPLLQARLPGQHQPLVLFDVRVGCVLQEPVPQNGRLRLREV